MILNKVVVYSSFYDIVVVNCVVMSYMLSVVWLRLIKMKSMIL